MVSSGISRVSSLPAARYNGSFADLNVVSYPGPEDDSALSDDVLVARLQGTMEYSIIAGHEVLAYLDLRTPDGMEGYAIVYARPRACQYRGALVGSDGRPTPNRGVLSNVYVSHDPGKLLQFCPLADLRLDLLRVEGGLGINSDALLRPRGGFAFSWTF